MHRVHIALQELQVVVLILHITAFCLSGKVVSLHLDNSTTKSHTTYHIGTVSLSLCRLAW